MAWNSFYCAAGIAKTLALPFYRGAEGAAHVPPGGCIVAAERGGAFDAAFLALAYAGIRLRPLHLFVREEAFSRWPAGWMLRSARAIPFREGGGEDRARMLRTALGWLAAGEAAGVFLHESTRPDAALLALESGVPVVPAAIAGPGRRAGVRFGRPVTLMEKERRYAVLPRSERAVLADNLGYRILRAVGELSGRECRE